MSKIYKSTDSHIIILRQRGLVINNDSNAKKIIEKENYYNLINGYKSLFLDSTNSTKNDKFLKNANFNELYSLYQFDRKLKSLLMTVILEIENNIKSYIASDFSKKYGHDNYLKISNFNTKLHPSEKYKTQAQKIGEISSLITNLQREISNQLNKNNPMISHYMLTYGYVPLWVLVNRLSFGTISIFYSHLLPKDQNDISKSFNIKPNIMKGFLFVLGIFRNACAHDERFYNLKSMKKDGRPNSIKTTYIHSNLNLTTNNYGKNDLFAIFIILKFLLNKRTFDTLCIQTKNNIDELSSELHCITINEVLDAMGFPVNWFDIKNV